jgi:hypothetical protein
LTYLLSLYIYIHIYLPIRVSPIRSFSIEEVLHILTQKATQVPTNSLTPWMARTLATGLERGGDMSSLLEGMHLATGITVFYIVINPLPF